MIILFEKINESENVVIYLEKRNLISKYKKCKALLLIWLYKNVDFRKREPKTDDIYYFRINKQYRAIGFIENKTFKVLKIDNHQ